MLYLLHGKDSFRSRGKLRELLDFFRAKSDNLAVFSIGADSFSKSDFEEKMKSQSLFEKKYIVVCDKIFENTEAADFIAENIARISASQNIFIFLEEEMDGKQVSLFKANAEKIQKFDLLSGAKLKKWMTDNYANILPKTIDDIIKNCGSDLWCVSKEAEKSILGEVLSKKIKKEEYNPFAICDAIAARNRNKAWLVFQESVFSGIPTEEVFWKIAWQIKNLLMVKKLITANVENLGKESGLHPFVVRKILSAEHNFTEKELEQFSFELVKIYHDARRGIAEIPIVLEKFLLNI